jgi:tetratricopeptide (TPR) repeat protein
MPSNPPSFSAGSTCRFCGAAMLENRNDLVCANCSLTDQDVTQGDFSSDPTVSDAPMRQILDKQVAAGCEMPCPRCGLTITGTTSANRWCERCLLEVAGAAFSPPPTELQSIPPIEIPGYRLMRQIGRGGMGVVWLAEQSKTRQKVAIKYCREDRVRLGSDSTALQRFEREMELAARLSHPHIARVYGGDEIDGIAYCVLEFVEGLNLAEFVHKHRLGQEANVGLMAKVAEAVQHAHQNGIIHRDLKPSNILVTEDGNPKVLDFGLAKALQDTGENSLQLSQLGQLLGTVRYMAPEQARGEAVDTRTDVYALGVILHEVLTGEHPHDVKGSDHVVLHRIAMEEPRRPRTLCRELDRELEILLIKTLDRVPDERYRTAGEFADDLRRWLRNEPLSAGVAVRLYFARKWLARHRAIAVATTAILAVTMAGIAFYMVRIRAERDQTHRLYTQVLAQNAELAIQRGEWQLALDNLNVALSANHPNSSELRLRRLDIYEGLNQTTARDQELQALGKIALNATQRARITFRHGEALWHQGHEEEALAQIKDAITAGLPPDEDAYAQGLIAEHADKALDHFRRALELGPYVHRYHQMLALNLVTGGYLDEARQQLQASRALYREDGNLPVMQAMIEARCGNDKAAEGILNKAGTTLTEADREIFRTHCELERLFWYGLVENWDGWSPDMVSERLPALMLKLVFSGRDTSPAVLKVGELKLPFHLQRSQGLLSQALMKFNANDFDGALALLDENERLQREATSLFVKGLIMTLRESQAAETPAQVGERLKKAVEAFDEASHQPSIYGGVPEQALIAAGWAELKLATVTVDIPAEERRAALSRSVIRFKRAVQTTRLRRHHVVWAVQAAIGVGDYQFARQAAFQLPEDRIERFETLINIERKAHNTSEALRLLDQAAQRFRNEHKFGDLRKTIQQEIPATIKALDPLIQE